MLKCGIGNSCSLLLDGELIAAPPHGADDGYVARAGAQHHHAAFEAAARFLGQPWVLRQSRWGAWGALSRPPMLLVRRG